MKQSKRKFSIKNKINIKNIINNIKEKRQQNKKILRHGSYSIGVTAIVIAIVVVLNLVIQELCLPVSEKSISAVKSCILSEIRQRIFWITWIRMWNCILLPRMEQRAPIYRDF